MKTTRAWPIPTTPLCLFNEPPYFLTISTYRPRPLTNPINRIELRLCSVDLWMGNVAGGADFSLDIVVGMGNINTITNRWILHPPEIPLLDSAHGMLLDTFIEYGITGGSAGMLATYHGPSDQAVLINNSQQVIGSLRPARPLRFKWRKEERPMMELYYSDGCPCIWGRPRIGPGGIGSVPTIGGMVTFEADQ